MSPERLEIIDRVLREGIRAGGFPGAAVVVGRKGATVWQKGFGHLGWTSDSPAVLPDQTIYDLASLTKVIGTTTAAMILFDEGKLVLDEKVTQLPARLHRRAEGRGHRPSAAGASRRPPGRSRPVANCGNA